MKTHYDVIKRKQFPRYWQFVRGIHWSPVNSQHKGQWRRALMFTLICARINGWVNNREAGDWRCHQAHCDVTIMKYQEIFVKDACNDHNKWNLMQLICTNCFILRKTFTKHSYIDTIITILGICINGPSSFVPGMPNTPARPCINLLTAWQGVCCYENWVGITLDLSWCK